MSLHLPSNLAGTVDQLRHVPGFVVVVNYPEGLRQFSHVVRLNLPGDPLEAVNHNLAPLAFVTDS
ncbi:hypothetical protein PG995_014999 [Apiospora arundinis]